MSSSSPRLFAGTAPYYARYRPSYPDQLFRRIVQAFSLDGRGHLLDVGCGPGTFTLPLSPYFSRVLAIDADPEMIEEGAMQARIQGVGGIEWRNLAAEQITPELGRFRLVTIASAFHWMDRDVVLQRCYEVAQRGGGLVISGGVSSWWESEISWHKAVISVIKAWLGPERLTSEGPYTIVEYERFEESLARSDFELFEHAELTYPYVWDIESIIGFLYSTSFANRSLLGSRTAGFEEEIQETLGQLSASGRFQEEITFDYFRARKS